MRAATWRSPSPDTGPTVSIRVAVIDDHRGVAEALARSLELEGDMVVVGCAATPWDARELLTREVDVVLLDVHFGSHDALALARELLLLQSDVRLVLMSDVADPAVLEQMLALGARGYVDKTQGLQRIVDVVRGAARDQIAIPASLFADLFGRPSGRAERTRASDALRDLLTERECEVLTLMASGMSSREIAEHLVLSVNTVRSHVQNTLTKLGVNSRLQAVAKAREAGLFPGGSASTSPSYGTGGVDRRRRP